MRNSFFLFTKQIPGIILCLVFVLFHEKIKGQNISCADTLTTSLYTSSSSVFKSTPIFYSIPTNDNGIVSMQNSQSYDSITVFKIDNKRQPVWAKNIRKYQNSNWQNIQELSNGDLLLTSADNSTSTCLQGCVKNLHLFLDNNGNFLYQCVYNNQSNDYGWLICNSGQYQSIVFAGTRLASNGGGILVDRYDTLLVPPLTLEERWRNGFSTAANSSLSYSLSNLFVVGNFVYIGGTYIDTLKPLIDAGIWMLKLDYNSGYLIDQKFYRLTNNSSTDQLTIQSSTPIAKSMSNKFTFTVQISHSSSSKIEIGYIQLDENLNISNSPIAVSTIALDATNAYPILNQTGTALYYLPEWHGLSYYAYIDNTNKLTAEQYHVTNIANNTVVFQYNLKNNNNVNVTISTGLNGSGNNYLQVSDIVPGFISNSGCITDSFDIFASSRILPIEEVNLNLGITLTPDIVTVSLPQTIPVNNFIIQAASECQQTSICNNIKLTGNNNFCFSDSAFIFNATKNNECLKKISWSSDTSFVSVFNTISDSSVSVQFKKPGKFYLYASVAGCGIADSILININPASANVNIGNDSLLCPNTMDTLRSKFSYQNYLWQNGSTDSFFVVKDAGQYYLTATDNCNNVSSDTVLINYDTSKLIAGAYLELCKLQDTLLTASVGFVNYEWQPADSIIGSASSQSIHIRPAATTTYMLSAQSISGCIVSDTVKVIVNNCLNKLIMPNAFSPNHDGINETIKPIIYGVIEKYDFSIYNRWGQLIFHSDKPGTGWNGAINNTIQNTGTFVWQCYYQFPGEKEKTDKGFFILIR